MVTSLVQVLGTLDSRLLNGVLDNGDLGNELVGGDIGLGKGDGADNGLAIGVLAIDGLGNIGLLDIGLLDNGLLDNGLGNGGVGDHLLSLHGLVFNVGFNSVLGDILDLGLVSVLGHVLGDVFDLLVVSVGLLHGLVRSLVHGLVLSDGLGHGDVLGSLLGNVFSDLSFIRNLLLGDNGFVIGVSLLDGDVLDVGSGLGSGLLVDHLGGLHIGDLGLHIGDLGLDHGLHEGLLHVLGLDVGRLHVLGLDVADGGVGEGLADLT
jgi:hypothetical protein